MKRIEVYILLGMAIASAVSLVMLFALSMLAEQFEFVCV